MSRVSKFLRRGADDKGGVYLTYYCQGCEEAHQVKVVAGGHPGPCWRWNGSVDSPTFEPSVLVRGVAAPDGRDCMTDAEETEYDAIYAAGGREAVFKSRFGKTCHTFIRNGQVQFLGDCTHKFAGQTVPLPELPPHMQSDRWSDGGE